MLLALPQRCRHFVGVHGPLGHADQHGQSQRVAAVTRGHGSLSSYSSNTCTGTLLRVPVPESSVKGQSGVSSGGGQRSSSGGVQAEAAVPANLVQAASARVGHDRFVDRRPVVVRRQLAPDEPAVDRLAEHRRLP